MTVANANEQYLLELINAERAKVGAQPLAFDPDLNEAAELHSQWMIAKDVFSHTGVNGTSSNQRMRDAGYKLSGSWSTGENIAYASTRAPAGTADEVKLLHTNLMNSSGHRANILNSGFREIGLGFEVGDYKGREAAFVTEDFGKTGSEIFLTGVTYRDKDADKFYDPGEGLGGITVTATSSAGKVYQTTVSAAGGYSMALPTGTYKVTFSGTGITTKTSQVTIGSKNVKLDLNDPATTASAATAAAAATAETDQQSGTLADYDSADDAFDFVPEVAAPKQTAETAGGRERFAWRDHFDDVFASHAGRDLAKLFAQDDDGASVAARHADADHGAGGEVLAQLARSLSLHADF